MKLYFALAFLALFAMAYGQDTLVEQRLMMDQLRSFGTGVVLVPIDRAALTITATGLAGSAAQAVSDSNHLQSNINDTLKNYTIIDIRNGGLYLEPRYGSDGSLSFAAHRSLSVVINAVDTPAIIDAMISVGASNISFVFTPDFYAVEKAQRQSLQLAVADALFKAQAVLDMINHCAFNISGIDIRNPNMELPSLTFNLFANMGNLRNYHNLNANQGSNLNANQGSNLNNLNNNNLNNNNLNNLNSQPMLLGAAAPFLEGDREQVVSYVEVWIRHALCSQGGSGMITDLTSSLDLSNIVGIAGGSFQPGSPIASPVTSPIASPVASPIVSPIASPVSSPITRSVRSTMW